MSAPARPMGATTSLNFSDTHSWRETIARLMTPLRIEAPGGSFTGTLAATGLGDATVFDMTTAPHIVMRTPDLIDQGGPRYFKVSLQISGVTEIIQDGRCAVLSPGDLGLYDVSRPYTLRMPQDSHAVVMLLPDHRVSLPAERLADLTAVTFPAHHAVGRFVNPLLLDLGRNAPQVVLGPHGAQLFASAVDLLVTMLSSEVTARQGTRSRHAELVRTIKTYADAHLQDPDLTPAAIAREHFISTRQLYVLFAEEGITVAAWIRRRRLERARRALADPSSADHSISAIASRFGLPDAAHFSTQFRSEFHESPRSWRARALGAAATAPGEPPAGAPRT